MKAGFSMKRNFPISSGLMFLIIACFAFTAYIFFMDKTGLSLTDFSPVEKPSPVEKIAPQDLTAPDLILLGARQEVKNKTTYNASYQKIEYPGGDVPANHGACTDVVIRAFRNAGYDLQKMIHEDMMANFALYPDNWGLTQPDSNIDHRRVPNQIVFFKRFGRELTIDADDFGQWHWGDVVYWRFANGDEHCGIISDKTLASGKPLVIHNAGIAKEENCLDKWEITWHYRFPCD
jgi:uncharacterized protein YijF (DUF1287 family)